MGIDELNDYERGEYDRVLGYEALKGQSEAYQWGYGTQYQIEQIQAAKAEENR